MAPQSNRERIASEKDEKSERRDIARRAADKAQSEKFIQERRERLQLAAEMARLEIESQKENGGPDRMLGIKKDGKIVKAPESVMIGGQIFIAPTKMQRDFAAIAKKHGSRPISAAQMKRGRKLPTYRNALPGWSVGKEMKGDDRCGHCKDMAPTSKRPFRECVVVPGHWNGGCANCYHYCHAVDCSLYDQSKRPLYERGDDGRMRKVKSGDVRV